MPWEFMSIGWELIDVTGMDPFLASLLDLSAGDGWVDLGMAGYPGFLLDLHAEWQAVALSPCWTSSICVLS